VYTFRRLTDLTDLEDFCRGYMFALEGVATVNPRAVEHYLMPSHVVGLYVDGELSGGFVMASGKNMLWTRIFPEYAASRGDDWLEACRDIDGVWLDASLRGTAAAALLWLRIAWDAGVGLRPNRLVYCVAHSRPGLVRLYDDVSVGVLADEHTAQGPTRLLWSTPAKFRTLPFTYGPRLLKRLFGRRMLSAQAA